MLAICLKTNSFCYSMYDDFQYLFYCLNNSNQQLTDHLSNHIFGNAYFKLLSIIFKRSPPSIAHILQVHNIHSACQLWTFECESQGWRRVSSYQYIITSLRGAWRPTGICFIHDFTRTRIHHVLPYPYGSSAVLCVTQKRHCMYVCATILLLRAGGQNVDVIGHWSKSQVAGVE